MTAHEIHEYDKKIANQHSFHGGNGANADLCQIYEGLLDNEKKISETINNRVRD